MIIIIIIIILIVTIFITVIVIIFITIITSITFIVTITSITIASLSFGNFCYSALQKGSIAPSGTAQSRIKVSSDKEENKAGTPPAIADRKPTTESTPAKKPPEKGTKSKETKRASGKKVLQDIPKPGVLKIES